MGAARAKCRPSGFRSRRDRAIIQISLSIDDSSDPWLDDTLNFWPIKDHHYAQGFAVICSFKTDDPPLWSGLLSPRADALRETGGFAPTATKTTIPSSIVGILSLMRVPD